MSLTARLRMVVAAALAAAGIGLASVEWSAAGLGPDCTDADILCPDLETVSPGDEWLQLDRNGKRLILRLSNRIANAGPGPLELRALPADETPAQCIDGIGDDNPDPDLNRGVVQRVYEDTDDPGSIGWFNREDEEERNSFTDHQVGCYSYHAVHNHWHFQDFSEYRLERLGGGEIGTSTKVGFCVLDQTTPYAPDNPLGTPPERHYPAGDSNCSNSADPVTSQGLSIGYADIYTYFTPGQAIDITGIAKGKYCLVSTANPLPRIYESDASDSSNQRRIRIQIKPRRNLVRERPLPC